MKVLLLSLVFVFGFSTPCLAQKVYSFSPPSDGSNDYYVNFLSEVDGRLLFRVNDDYVAFNPADNSVLKFGRLPVVLGATPAEHRFIKTEANGTYYTAWVLDGNRKEICKNTKPSHEWSGGVRIGADATTLFRPRQRMHEKLNGDFVSGSYLVGALDLQTCKEETQALPFPITIEDVEYKRYNYDDSSYVIDQKNRILYYALPYDRGLATFSYDFKTKSRNRLSYLPKVWSTATSSLVWSLAKSTNHRGVLISNDYSWEKKYELFLFDFVAGVNREIPCPVKDYAQCRTMKVGENAAGKLMSLILDRDGGEYKLFEYSLDLSSSALKATLRLNSIDKNNVLSVVEVAQPDQEPRKWIETADSYSFVVEVYRTTDGTRDRAVVAIDKKSQQANVSPLVEQFQFNPADGLIPKTRIKGSWIPHYNPQTSTIFVSGKFGITAIHADSAQVTQNYNHPYIPLFPLTNYVPSGAEFFTIFATGPKLYLMKQITFDKNRRWQVQITENP